MSKQGKFALGCLFVFLMVTAVVAGRAETFGQPESVAFVSGIWYWVIGGVAGLIGSVLVCRNSQ
jgi:hypothetical protein